MRSKRQLVATDGNGFAYFCPFRAPTICRQLPPAATTGLHKGSIFRCLIRLRQLAVIDRRGDYRASVRKARMRQPAARDDSSPRGMAALVPSTSSLTGIARQAETYVCAG